MSWHARAAQGEGMAAPPRCRPDRKGWAVHARTITIDARPELIDAGIALVRDEIFDAVTQMPGCVGMSFVADRASGRCIATTAWESEQALRDSEERVRPLRERSASVFGGSPQVEEWEIVVMHRDHRSGEGAGVRSTWLQTDPSRMDNSIDVFRSTTLPTAEGFDGFCSASLLVNRSNGRALATFAYDGPESLARTREQANALRSRSSTELGGTVEDVREFELVMPHLHVPEMA